MSLSSTRFRQRKISVKQTLSVLWQRDLPDLEDDQQRDLQDIETGVEKAEEEEEHLQQVITANKAFSTEKKVYIPTPDASKQWSDYTKFYHGKFVPPSTYIRGSATVEETCGIAYCMDEQDEDFLKKLNENIELLAEKCTEDEFELVSDKFENYTNEHQPYLSKTPDQIMSLDDMMPFIIEGIKRAENDPTSPEFLLKKLHNKSLPIYAPLGRPMNTNGRSHIATFKRFAPKIYPHWKSRRLNRGGKPVFPSLKFEDQSLSEKDNDNDPYVCFRRREVRQVRKTRRADQQVSERLRKLQAEMEAARKLVAMVVRREELRREALRTEWDVFEKRCKIKTLKRQLGIKGEDEDLVNHKKKKIIEETVAMVGKAGKDARGGSPAVAAQSENSVSGPMSVNNINITGKDESTLIPPNVKLPASKIPDLELLTIEEVLHEKETMIRNAVKGKLKVRQQNDHGWVNYTDNPFVPYCDYFDQDDRDYIRIIDGKHAAYSSLCSPYPPSANVALKLPLAASLGSSYANRVEVSPVILRARLDDESGDVKIISENKEKELHASIPVQRNSAVALRKRRGRNGRMLIDRRGLMRQASTIGGISERVTDRYKYDDETNLDNMEFGVTDPSMLNNIPDTTQSVRFGSMLLSKAYENYREAYQARQQQLYALQQRAAQEAASNKDNGSAPKVGA